MIEKEEKMKKNIVGIWRLHLFDQAADCERWAVISKEAGADIHVAT